MVARVAEVCDDQVCAHALVRGDKIEFVSVEQSRAAGCTARNCKIALNDEALESDIKLPHDFVLVHDTQSVVFDRCTLYVVRWRGKRDRIDNVHEDDLKVAEEYFKGPPEAFGAVEVPRGPWRKIADVQHIRYCRHGVVKGFNHHFHPAVTLYACERPLAWKLKLPNGCVITDHGFIRP